MDLSFYETMCGHLVDGDGCSHRVDVRICGEARRLRRLATSGTFRISGLVRAGPWAQEAPIEGTLVVSPLRQRGMIYRFSFRDEEDQLYTFVGKKRLHPARLLRTATTLHCTLMRDGREVATGELRFDLNDLPALIGSFAPEAQMALLEAAKPTSTEAIPDPRDRTRLRAWAEAVLAEGEKVPPLDEVTIDGAVAFLDGLPSHVRTPFGVAFRALDALSMARTGRPFTSLSIERRRALVEWMATSSNTTRQWTLLLGMPVKAAHFSRLAYLEAVGLPSMENPVAEPPPRYLSQVTTPEELDAEVELEAEVLVIGTGAGGGPVAAHLAEAGYAVAILEEGDYQQRAAFSGDLMDRMRTFWRDAGLSHSLGNAVVSLPLGRLVGGSTAINSGTCFRTPGPVLEEWRNVLGFPESFSEAGMEPYFRAVEQELQVTRSEWRHLGKIADLLKRGAAEMGGEVHALDRNAPACDAQGVCTLGCPTDAKRSTNVSYIPRALESGAELFTGMRAMRIWMRGRRAVMVEARGKAPDGTVKTLRIRAENIVVSCGSIHTPLLLRGSGIRSPWLGKNLSVHPGIGMFVLCDEPMDPWHAIPQGCGVTGLASDRLRFEGFWVPPQFSGPIMPLDGPELTRWMDAQHRMGQFGFMVKDPGVGRVRRGPNGRPVVQYSLTPEVLDAFREGSAVLAELLLRGGGKEVLAAVGMTRVVRTIEEARALGKREMKASDLALCAFHPLGTCRLGKGPEDGVLDWDHRVHGTENLFVVDGSAVPTSLGVNPQITIMSLAVRAAERIAQRMSSG